MKKLICLLLLCGLLLPLFGAAIPSTMQAEALDPAIYPQENGSEATELAFSGRTAVDPNNCDTYVAGNTDWQTAFKNLTATNNVYEISTANQLLGFFYALSEGTTFSGKIIKLTKDFDLSAFAGSIQVPSTTEFAGTFDGQGNVVKGYKTVVTTDGVSMFGTLNGATIKYVSFVDCLIDAYYESHESGADRIAQKQASLLAIASMGSTAITNVYVGGQVYGGTSNLGGLVGEVKGGTLTVKDCQIKATFQGPKDEENSKSVIGSAVGGMIGLIADGASATVTGCNVTCNLRARNTLTPKTYTSTGTEVNGKPAYTVSAICGPTDSGYTAFGYGGVIGSVKGSLSISNCTVDGSLSITGSGIGGLIGSAETDKDLTVNNCNSKTKIALYSNSDIEATTDKIFVSSATSQTAYSTSKAETYSYYAGGILGRKLGTGSLTILSCTNTGSVAGYSRTGGMVGYVTGSGSTDINGCTNKSSITARGYLGGMVGQFENVSGNTSFVGCTNEGAITGTRESTGGQIAGIVGQYIGLNGNEVLFENCTNKGDVKHEGDNTGGCWMGGIAGYVMGKTDGGNEFLTSVTFTNCHNMGNLFANRSSGGLVGFVQRAKELTVTGCTVDAELYFQIHDNGNLRVGGLIGIVNLYNMDDATITGCTVSGKMTIYDPQGVDYTAGGLIGEIRQTDVFAQNSKIDLAFEKLLGDENDVINRTVGYSANGGSLACEGVTYVAHEIGVAVTDPKDQINLTHSRAYFKEIGVQYRLSENVENCYDLRYVFGVNNLQDLDKAIGFEVTAKELGKEVTTKITTVYCPNIYSKINVADGKSVLASEYGCDYLCTLVIGEVPASMIEEVKLANGETVAYIKNTILNFTLFTLSGEGDTAPNKNLTVSSTRKYDRHTFQQEDFTPYLPSAFEGAEGIISSKNITYPAEFVKWSDGVAVYQQNASLAQNLDSVNYKSVNSKNSQYMLQAKDTASTVGWSANGAMVYRVNTADPETIPHHYYIDLDSFNNHFDPDIDDLYEAYYSFDFEVEEAGYYDFCFRIRLNGGSSQREIRNLLVQFDDETYGEQTELYYNVVIKNGTMRDNAQNHDSYLTGYNRYLTAGKHTITFRAPYGKYANIHMRDIYLIKDAPEPVDADIPLPEGAVLYDGNFDNNVTYVLDATTKDKFDAYRETLASYGFALKEDRRTNFKYSDFDVTNTPDTGGGYTYVGNYTGNTTYHNYYYIYTNADYMLNVYFCTATGDMRVIVSDAEEYEKYAKVNAEAEAYNASAVTTPMFAILDIGGKDITLKQGTNKGSKITGVTNGMCLVYRLSDGRFIVVDGGFWNEKDTEGEAVARLYDWLRQHADYDNDMDYTNNKVTIAAWLITHHHSDHISVAWKFDQMYRSNPLVEVENYLYNFPSYEYAMSIYGVNLSPSAYDSYYPQMHSMMSANNTLVAHTGMLYNFADCSIEILFTHEDFYPNQFKSYNNSNTVYKITLAGKTFLVAGDLEEPGQIDCIKQTGTLLQADFLQPTHHGFNGQVEFYQYIVGKDESGNFNTDTIIIWPLPKGEIASYFTSNDRKGVANRWLAEMFRNENDQANDNIHYAVENWEYYILNWSVEEDDGGYSNIVPF